MTHAGSRICSVGAGPGVLLPQQLSFTLARPSILLRQVAALCWRLHWHITLPLRGYVQAEAAPYCRAASRFVAALVVGGGPQQATVPPALAICDVPGAADEQQQQGRFELFLMLVLALVAPLVPLGVVEYQTRAAFARNRHNQLVSQRHQPQGSAGGGGGGSSSSDSSSSPHGQASAPQAPISSSSSDLGLPAAAGRAASPLFELLLSACWMIVQVQAAVVGAYFVAVAVG